MTPREYAVAALAAVGVGTGGTSLVSDQTLTERVAVVEVKLQNSEKTADEIKQGVKSNSEKLDSLRDLILERR